MFWHLRSISCWFLLGIYLAAATPASELLKLPILFEHYHEHQQESPGISVPDFLILHYFNGNPRDDDYDRDMQLPFKTLEVAPFALLALPQPIATVSFVTPPATVLRKQIMPLELLCPPTPFVAMPAEPPEA